MASAKQRRHPEHIKALMAFATHLLERHRQQACASSAGWGPHRLVRVRTSPSGDMKNSSLCSEPSIRAPEKPLPISMPWRGARTISGMRAARPCCTGASQALRFDLYTDLLPPIAEIATNPMQALPSQLRTARTRRMSQTFGACSDEAGLVHVHGVCAMACAPNRNTPGLAEGHHSKALSARLRRRQRHECLGQLGLQLVKHGRADALGAAPHDARDLAAARVAAQAHLVNRWAHTPSQ